MSQQEITKNAFFDEVFARLEDKSITKKQCIEVLKTCFEHITMKIEQGWKIKINGFGNFSRVLRKQRKGRNPFTGEIVEIPPKQSVSFKPSKCLLAKVNEKSQG